MKWMAKVNGNIDYGHYFFLECVPFFLISRATSVHSSLPRVQTTVPSLRELSESGIMHLMSSGLGQGQSTGFVTHSSVTGHRY